MASKLSPAGVVQLNVQIAPQQFPTDLKVGDFFDVLVGEVFSPSMFFVQLVQPDLVYSLDDLVDEMLDTYAGDDDPGLEVSWEDVKVGINCAAKVEGENTWYRVVVHMVNSITSIQIKLIDFGGTFTVHLLNLRWLLTQFCSLPAQAVPAKLACLCLPHGSSSWPQASVARLLDMTRTACEIGGLVARMEGWQGDKVELSLYDTVTNTDLSGVDLRKVLVEEGLARMTTTIPGDIKYLEEMLSTSRTYKYQPLRCPDFLRADLPLQDIVLGNQSSELSEDTSIKTQLKSLLNLQNKVHSLVSKNIVTEDEDIIFSKMTALQSQYQALLARLLSRTATTGYGAAVTQRRGSRRLSGGWEDSEEEDILGASMHSFQDNRGEECGGNLSTDPAVTSVLLSTGRTLHPVSWQDDCWVTSAEISSLVPRWQGWDLLYSMLTRKKVAHKFLCLEILASHEECLFQHMIVEEVGGVFNKKSGKLLDSVTLYKFTDLPVILEVFDVTLSKEDLLKIRSMLK